MATCGGTAAQPRSFPQRRCRMRAPGLADMGHGSKNGPYCGQKRKSGALLSCRQQSLDFLRSKTQNLSRIWLPFVLAAASCLTVKSRHRMRSAMARLFKDQAWPIAASRVGLIAAIAVSPPSTEAESWRPSRQDRAAEKPSGRDGIVAVH
jgi:hypothetical protein